MKKNLNRKGFTLIELLAVIVILAILVTISVPAVTKKLAEARKSTYLTNAERAVEAVRNEVISNGMKNSGYSPGTTTYSLADINGLLEKGNFDKSSYGAAYNTTESKVTVTISSTGEYQFKIVLCDEKGNGVGVQGSSGVAAVDANNLSEDSVIIGGLTSCIPASQ